MDIRLLGPLRAVASSGTELGLGGRNQQAVFATLLSGRRQAVSRDRLIDAVWGDVTPVDPANAVQHYVSRLRRILASTGGSATIRRDGTAYVLDIDRRDVDADRFIDAVDAARQAQRADDPARAEALLTSGLTEFRSTPYEGLDVDVLVPEIGVLEEARIDAQEDLFGLRLALGMHRESIAELEQLSSQNPWRERLWAHLMTALYRSGRPADALRAFQRARHLMVESLGIDPSPQLRTLEQQILEEDPALVSGISVTALPTRGTTGALPTVPTSFIGRAEIIRTLADAVTRADVITILGASGVGKSRVAIEFAASAAAHFSGGCRFVRLEGLADPSAVASVVAGAVGLRESPNRVLAEAVADHIAAMGALVVLDGCERVAGECVALVARLRRRESSSVILTTSTTALGIEAEVRLELPPLAAASSSGEPGEGVELFIDRAHLVVPGWEPSPLETELVERAVTLVDGSPLAIELAAAGLDVRSLSDITTQLERRSLPGGPDDERRRRLVDLAEWGMSQLTPAEADAFETLAVFVQGFGRGAARAVAFSTWSDIEVDAFLRRLTSRSLIRVDRSADGVRYVIPSGLREIAHERLNARHDHDEIQRAHARWFAQWVVEAERGLRGSDAERWVRLLSREHPNLRAALTFSHDSGDTAVVVELVASLCRYWDWTGRLADALSWVSRAIDSSTGAESPARTWTQIWAVYFAGEAGDPDAALAIADEVLASGTASDPAQRAAAFGNVGIVQRSRGELGPAVDFGRRAVAEADEAADPWFRFWAKCSLALTLFEAHETDEAAQLADASLTGFRHLGDRAAEAWSLDLLGRIAMDRGDRDGAEHHARQSLLTAHLLGARRTTASCLQTLSLVAQGEGNLARAVRLLSAANLMLGSDQAAMLRHVRAVTEEAARLLTPGEYTAAWNDGRRMHLETVLTA